MEEDYFNQESLNFNFRYFLPRTYFIIPNIHKGYYKNLLYNEDLLNLKYGLNQSLKQKSIQFIEQNGEEQIKNKMYVEYLYLINQSNNKKQEIIMVQKKVDKTEDILREDRWIETYCFNNTVYSNLDNKILNKYFNQEQSQILSNRIFEIQKYLSRFLIKGRDQCKKDINQFAIEIQFIDHEGKNKRPYVANIFNTKLVQYESKKQNLIEIDFLKNYIQSDQQFKIFKYDYEFRLKRVATQCVSNYKYHDEWLKQQEDFHLIQSFCNLKDIDQNNINQVYKRCDVLLMKKLDKSKAMIKNLTIYNYLENSDKINNKWSFYQLSQELDQNNQLYNFTFSSYLPKTYVFNLNKAQYQPEELKFMELNNPDDMWITKPLDQKGGRGIQIYQNSTILKEYINQTKFLSQQSSSNEEQMIVQKYIHNPLLLKGRKFDIRSYVIVISTDPYIVYFLNGYIRLTINAYQKNDTSLFTHLVNTNIQKKHPDFNKKKDDSHWDLQQFEDVLQQEQNMTQTQIEDLIYLPIKKASAYLFKGIQQQMNKYNSNFQIFGLDFMFDSDFNPYFIEVNEIPQLVGQTQTHKRVCPSIVIQQLNSCLYANGQILKGETINMETLQQKCYNCTLLINEQETFFLQKK